MASIAPTPDAEYYACMQQTAQQLFQKPLEQLLPIEKLQVWDRVAQDTLTEMGQNLAQQRIFPSEADSLTEDYVQEGFKRIKRFRLLAQLTNVTQIKFKELARELDQSQMAFWFGRYMQLYSSPNGMLSQVLHT